MWAILPAALIATCVGLMGVPWSPTRMAYRRLIAEVEGAPSASWVFAEAEIARLPSPVRRYLRHCGYLDTPHMTHLRTKLSGVEFVASGRVLTIDYQQLNLTSRPERYALISFRIACIPFEGSGTAMSSTSTETRRRSRSATEGEI